MPQVHAPVPHGEPGPAVERLRIKPARYQHDAAVTTVIARNIRIERGCAFSIFTQWRRLGVSHM